jgi:hypothetical protein
MVHFNIGTSRIVVIESVPEGEEDKKETQVEKAEVEKIRKCGRLKGKQGKMEHIAKERACRRIRKV